MRCISGKLIRERALRFGDYLLTMGITSDLRGEGEAWTVWVHSEDDVKRAESEYQAYTTEMSSTRYEVKAKADGIRSALLRETEKPTPVVTLPKTSAMAVPGWAEMPVSICLIGLSVLVALFSELGRNAQFLQFLHCSPRMFTDGELWRFVAPVFIHYGFFHVFFNMMWLRQLGGLVEVGRGWVFFLVLVIAIAVVSNLAQYWMQGPAFGGMSGVVYGLFGYVWGRSRWDPDVRYQMDSVTIYLMLAWLAMGFSGLVGPVANWCHGVGLVMGGVTGLAPGWLRGPRRG